MPDEQSVAPDEFHLHEAIRHLHAAVENASCGVCADLWSEESDHHQTTEDLRERATAIAAVQAEKRAQLEESGEEPPLTREYVEERIHAGPEGTHREVVRGIESEPRPLGFAPVGLARSWMKDRPRLTEMLALGKPHRP